MAEDTDDAFDMYERSLTVRSVIEVEQERIARGYPADEALLKFGFEIEDEILRKLSLHSKLARPTEILEFPKPFKSGDE